MDTDRISHDIVIDAPIARVWEALTRPEELSRWFGSAGEFARGDGQELRLRWEEHGTFIAHIEREEAPHRFAWRWALRPDEQPRRGNSTHVDFVLAETGGLTRVEVTETGFTTLDETPGQRADAVNDNLAGWVGGLMSLKQYLEGYAESALPDRGGATPV
ncbi:uncharacterized protein YndB with AHSA1/START domain [Stackebrandtia albiflava]|uniref:Uncharacterized protein YndB with AHSA1/START domain n=1 Tax=Stackebrandtia albiflava TaxID=406432 RepID=A0A562VE83_9ACTN|nr:SRPBCC domain-containing protein [Stackebrandtia albiflava]TWJ16196.1 uncharacterized protein YndB with AHSA1/START domain [Stackebrandtia albiflava]